MKQIYKRLNKKKKVDIKKKNTSKKRIVGK